MQRLSSMHRRHLVNSAFDDPLCLFLGNVLKKAPARWCLDKRRQRVAQRIEVGSEIPYLRHRSFVFAPASASLSTPMICSSVNRFAFIVRSHWADSTPAPYYSRGSPQTESNSYKFGSLAA